ncbi:MAG: MlaD family protein [Fibrobacter sp.]|jgi:phospholipid/cholesterol/gamma-HCH transport system substrate-binding protein|nr:MlaD family protein [Fibrobacter sp.]
MSKLREYTSGNKRTAFVLLVILVLIGWIWFTFHPLSPKHKRSVYYIKYGHVGLLSAGNRVLVNGLPFGKVVKTELHDDYVLVTVSVYSSTPIPKNSAFLLINSGLMGEREVSVMPSESGEMLASGDTVTGSYEPGLNVLMAELKGLFSQLDTIFVSLETGAEDLFGKDGEKIENLVRKGKKITTASQPALSEWKTQVLHLLDSGNAVIAKTETLLDNSFEKSKPVPESILALQNGLSELGSAADSLKFLWNRLRESPAAEELPKITAQSKILFKNIDSLLQDIRKNGIRLNVDIF